MTTYRIKIIYDISYNQVKIPYNCLVSSIRGWVGYFGKHENSYLNECYLIKIYLTSIKIGTIFTANCANTLLNGKTFKYLGIEIGSLVVLEDENCNHVLTTPSILDNIAKIYSEIDENNFKNILDKILLGELKDGDIVNENLMRKYKISKMLEI